MPLTTHFQNGYVTRDLDRAIDLVSSRFGLGDFKKMDIELPLDTPEGSKTACLRVATAWAGPLQVELIEPVSGYVDHYLRGLPADEADGSPRFHHIAARCESDEAMRLEVERLGLPLVFSSGGAGIQCVFVDACAHIGHHLELVSATPEGWALLGLPRS